MPTQAELAQAEALEGPVHIAVGRETDRAIVERFHQAQEDGESFGIVQYAVHPSDHTLTDDGIDLPPSGERTLQGEDGALLSLREYEFPLPEAAQEARDIEHKHPADRERKLPVFRRGHLLFPCPARGARRER